MSKSSLIIVVCSLLIQLGMAYVRYVPFARVVDGRTKKRLVAAFAGSTLFDLLWMSALMIYTGGSVMAYKFLALVGWIPYLAASLLVIRGFAAQQIFVTGMSGFWYMLLHSLAAIGPLLLNPNMLRTDLRADQMISYVILLILFMPLLRYMFKDLLPSRYFMNEKSYSYYIAVLPFLICVAQAPGSMTMNLWGPARLTGRLLMLLCFLALWRYIVLAGREVEKEVEKESAYTLAQKAIRFFQHAEIMNKKRMEEMSIFRHDVRHHMRAVYSLASAGRVDEIKDLLHSLDDELEKTVVHPYCLNPIINAVVSVYFARAEERGIQLSHKLALPEKLPGLENDLAFFLANLLENAINAASVLPEGKRVLKVKCLYNGGQIVLSIENSTKGILQLGEDGYPLPASRENGHGIGTLSIARFVNEHHVVKNYSQTGDLVHFTAYFTVDGEKKTASRMVQALKNE